MKYGRIFVFYKWSMIVSFVFYKWSMVVSFVFCKWGMIVSWYSMRWSYLGISVIEVLVVAILSWHSFDHYFILMKLLSYPGNHKWSSAPVSWYSMRWSYPIVVWSHPGIPIDSQFCSRILEFYERKYIESLHVCWYIFVCI